jgi:RNA polymerase sigma factor (sigma-70 family)
LSTLESFAGTARASDQLAKVLRDYAGMITRIASAFEANPAGREDLSQEIGVRLWRALPGFRGDGSLAAFVATIAHHVAVEWVARAVKHGANSNLDACENLIDPKPEPDANMQRLQQRARLLKAIRKLPLGLAEVMVLTLEGFSQNEIAAMLGIQSNLVAVRAHRAREHIKLELEQ